MSNQIQVVECTNSEFELRTVKVECVRVIPKQEPIHYTVVAKQIHCFGDILLAETFDWNEAYRIRDSYQLQSPQKHFGVRSV